MTGQGTQQAELDGSFVNPYTFIPLPELAEPQAFRREPAGHARLGADRYCGWIDVELTARSPLLVRGAYSGDEGRFPKREVGGAKVPFIPGSSLAGVVRSLYEVLAGGCLRVFGEDFVPGYRQAARAEEGWTLARIETSENGRPGKLRLCKQVVWVPAGDLAEQLGGVENVRSGTTLAVDAAGASGSLRNELTDKTKIGPGDGWVMLVTDAGARHKSYWCAVGELGDDQAELSDKAWQNYQHAVAGADDIRRARGDEALRVDSPVEAPVHFDKEGSKNPPLIGYRHEARQKLFAGQVVWVRTTTERVSVGKEATAQAHIEKHVVTELLLSQVWRHAGAGSAGERVPETLLPCPPRSKEDREREEDRDKREKQLCPACRVFGSADTSGKHDQQNRQVSYRGHVRFSEALPEGPTGVRPEVLPPLGVPRPGSGQFYLRTAPNSKPRQGTWALRKWGAYPDQDSAKEPRQLRGRKAYWLTERHKERPLFRVRNRVWEDNKMASTGESVDAGTVFRYRVHVEGLSPAEAGGLLAALDPALVLDGSNTRIGFAVGGGRPLGYGSCTARITGTELRSARARYAGLPGDSGELATETALAAFRDSVDPGVRATWPAAAAALTLDQVEPGNVWYPPEKPLPPGRLTVDDLAAGFDFWDHSRGEMLKKKTFPLVQLPEVDADSQQLPVRPEVKQHPNTDRNNPGRGGNRPGGRK